MITHTKDPVDSGPDFGYTTRPCHKDGASAWVVELFSAALPRYCCTWSQQHHRYQHLIKPATGEGVQPRQRCVSGAQQKRGGRKPLPQIAADRVAIIGRTRVRDVVHRIPAGPSMLMILI